MPTILIVDDAPKNLSILSGLLQPCYRVKIATSGDKALRVAAGSPGPDLVLLDVMMPGLNGYEVFARLRERPATADIPIIFVTAMDSIEAELQGLEAGAVDYITKPVVPPILLARVRNQLELKHARDLLKDQNAWLEAEVASRIRDNDLIQWVGIRALAQLAEIRDPETGNHIRRTQGYVHSLALRLSRHPRFCTTLTPRYIDLLTRSAPLHDIGKVGIPDAILQKPGKLTATEWEIMKTHARLGAEAIELAERDGERTLEFLVLAKEIAHRHHEKWNGEGYPDGLAGDAIPLSARVMAVADVFDALISPRVYKAGCSYEEARGIIVAGRGSHFDPDIVDAFLESFGEFVAIAERHTEGGGGG